MTLQELIAEYCYRNNMTLEQLANSTTPIEIKLLCIRDDNYYGEISSARMISFNEMELYIEGEW